MFFLNFLGYIEGMYIQKILHYLSTRSLLAFGLFSVQSYPVHWCSIPRFKVINVSWLLYLTFNNPKYSFIHFQIFHREQYPFLSYISWESVLERKFSNILTNQFFTTGAFITCTKQIISGPGLLTTQFFPHCLPLLVFLVTENC